MLIKMVPVGEGSPAPTSNYKMNTFLKIPKYADPDNDVPIYKNVKMRVSSDNTAIKLVSIKTDNTESEVQLKGSINTNYITDFCINRIMPVNISSFFIMYRYKTSDTDYSAQFYRGCLVKVDGTISIGSEYTICSVSNATYTRYGWFGRSITGGGNPNGISGDPIMLSKTITNSTGYYQMLAYQNMIQPFNQNAPNTSYGTAGSPMNTSAGASTYFPDPNRCHIWGGFFYSNNNGVPYVGLYDGYNGYQKSASLAYAGADLAAIGMTDHYFLGLTELGYLVTISFNTGYIYIWNLIPNYAISQNFFILIDSIDISTFTDLFTEKIYTFIHNTIITETGKRYKISCLSGYYVLNELDPYEIETDNPYIKDTITFGLETDAWEGILIIGE